MEVLSFNLLSTWLIETQRPMLCAWLDALGIEHGENGCADISRPQPDGGAAQEGRRSSPQADSIRGIVSVYLRCFNQIDETRWPALDEILRTDPRLQPKAALAA